MSRIGSAVGIALAATLLAAAPASAQSGSQPPAAAAPDALTQLDGFVLGMTEAGAFSGVVLVARGDRVLFEKAYGKVDPQAEDGAAASIDTRYNIASAGKMFTATAILQLVAAGKLSLDAKVGDILPDYPNRDVAAQVSVRHLLLHTDGTGGIDLFGAENAANRAAVRSVADLIALHAARPLAFPPGTKQDYDNFGFVILGRMVEVVSGENYEAYIARHVFGPAGMTRTGFVDCTARAGDIAVGYATVADKLVVNCATQPTRGLPAGGQLSTARDMYRFMRALQTGKLAPPALFAEATRTHLKFMGLGFFATEYGKDVPLRDFRWGHGGGGQDGSNTDIRAYPRTGEIVIVLANHDAPAAHAVARFLHAQYALKYSPAVGR